jgi:DNA-directed RNA polymerase specialized sigma24 family protein
MGTQSNAFSISTKPAAMVDFEAVYHRELPRVYSFFRYRVGDDEVAEDLTAETFEKAWRKREQYRADLASFSTWLFALARRVAADYYRKQRPTSPLGKRGWCLIQHPSRTWLRNELSLHNLQSFLRGLQIASESWWLSNMARVSPTATSRGSPDYLKPTSARSSPVSLNNYVPNGKMNHER